MSFLFPGWYLIEYGAGTDTKQITGFIEGGTDVGGLASFVRVESSDAHGKRVRHIQVGLIQSMEEIASPGKKTEEKPAEKETKPAERTETNFPPATAPLPLAVRVDWLCGECEHSLDSHASNGRCGYVILVPDEDDPFAEVTCPCRVDPDALTAFFALDAQARLASIQERARECVAAEEEQPTPDRQLCRICQHQMNRHTGGAVSMCATFGCTCPLIESKAEPAQEELIAANFRKVCKWCHHTQAWHPPVGSSAECQYPDCHCPVLRGDPVFQEAEEAKAQARTVVDEQQWSKIIQNSLRLRQEQAQPEQKPAAAEQSKLEERLGDYLVKMADALGISREPFIAIASTLSGKTIPSQKDTFASFEQALGEARADLLQETVDQKIAPVFRSCVDCGDPWMWHQSERGGFCHAHDCNCQNLRTQEEKFVPEGAKS